MWVSRREWTILQARAVAAEEARDTERMVRLELERTNAQLATENRVSREIIGANKEVTARLREALREERQRTHEAYGMIRDLKRVGAMEIPDAPAPAATDPELDSTTIHDRTVARAFPRELEASDVD